MRVGCAILRNFAMFATSLVTFYLKRLFAQNAKNWGGTANGFIYGKNFIFWKKPSFEINAMAEVVSMVLADDRLIFLLQHEV